MLSNPIYQHHHFAHLHNKHPYYVSMYPQRKFLNQHLDLTGFQASHFPLVRGFLSLKTMPMNLIATAGSYSSLI